MGLLPMVFNKFANLVERCWDENPMKRPNLNEIARQLEELANLLVNDEKKKEDSAI